MKRRDFVIRVGGTLLVVPAVLKVTACGDSGGDDDGSQPDAGPATSFTGTNADASGHSHSFTVQCTDLSSATAVMYTASGAGHTHSISLTPEQLTSLAAGNTVEFDTTDVHPHSWTVAKPANACA